MPPLRLSELECFVLGLVWQLGPCSAYEVRRHLRESPSTQWSASAGAIYPLLRRLELAKLVRATDEPTGNRKRRTYAATVSGRRALRRWIGPPLSRDAITVVHDPLRSRARFLALLEPSERHAWIESARDSLATVADRVQQWHQRHAPPAAHHQNENPDRMAPISQLFRDMMTRHGEMDVQMRRAWLDEL
ncbi:MAG: PadR family transcriptional regulator, partial [Pyrinomonadaceae bacterium]|nr:PadR family transcriptional regulator [Phycisphaerales bacterium]